MLTPAACAALGRHAHYRSAAADLREPAQTFRAQAKLFFPIESSSCGACHTLKPYGQPPVTPLRKSLEKLFHRARPVL